RCTTSRHLRPWNATRAPFWYASVFVPVASHSHQLFSEIPTVAEISHALWDRGGVRGRVRTGALASWAPTPSILLHREPGLCRHSIYPGQDVHHASRLGIRHDGPRYATPCRGMGGRQRYALRPAWLDLKRHRDTINRTPLGVLHPHDQLGKRREALDIAC